MKKTNALLYIYSILGFIALAFITMRASNTINVIEGASNLWKDDWFKATIVDFYNNQILIFFWVTYKETNIILLLLYFVLSIFFGSFFSIAYVVFHLFREKNIKNLICKTKRIL